MFIYFVFISGFSYLSMLLPEFLRKKNGSIIFIHTTFQCNYSRNFELKALSLMRRALCYTEMSTCASSESYCKRGRPFSLSPI